MSGPAPQPGATGGLWVARKVELSPGRAERGKGEWARLGTGGAAERRLVLLAPGHPSSLGQ